MSSDDSDKTVFKPAGGGGNPDHTVMRPMPGGRGFGGAPQPQQPQYRPQLGGGQRPPPPQQKMDVEAAFFRNGKGLNPIVNAAAPLLAVFKQTRGSMSHPDIGGLHQRLTSEIRACESRLRESGVSQQIVLSARYILCSALDEAVLNTPWGSESAWAQRTLLSIFHNEGSGGEKFYLILDRMRQSPAENIFILELFYVLLSLGFEGRYRLDGRGRDAIEQIRDELFTIIRRYRGDYERQLSDRWQGLGRTKNTLTEYIPMWVIVTVVIAVMFFGFSGFRYWLYQSSTPVAEQLHSIAEQAVEKKEEKE